MKKSSTKTGNFYYHLDLGIVAVFYSTLFSLVINWNWNINKRSIKCGYLYFLGKIDILITKTNTLIWTTSTPQTGHSKRQTASIILTVLINFQWPPTFSCIAHQFRINDTETATSKQLQHQSETFYCNV